MMNKIYNSDAADILPSIPTDSADMIFTDPPYNATNLKMDKAGFDLKNYLSEFKRILKPNGWFFCFGTMVMHSDIIQSKTFKRKFEYIWDKGRGMPKFSNAITPMTSHEIICVFYHPELKKMTDLYMDKKSLRTPGAAYTKKHNLNQKLSEFRKSHRHVRVNAETINTGYREGLSVLKNYPSKQLIKHAERTAHPTQKPLELCKLITKAYCPPDGLILDPFCGSGTIPHAAALTNRKYIGIEINKEYYDIAQNRINGMLVTTH